MFKQYNTYKDVELALNKALHYGGGIVHCSSPGMAVNWRQRAYRFRNKWQEFTAKTYAEIPERADMAGTSPWDDAVIRTEGNKCVITFERKEVMFESILGGMESLEVRAEPEPEVVGPLGLEAVETVAEGAYRSGPPLTEE